LIEAEGEGKEAAPPSSGVGDALKSLGTQLGDPCLKSSTRVLILFSLALNARLGFTDLLNLTGTGKGSLSNHLEKLEASGYIRTKRTMTFGGPRIVAEISPKGMEAYSNLVKALDNLGK
jgi:DNA-binding MarR family transcriptional regulator